MFALKSVPTNMIEKLFEEVSINLDGLPEDREILKYYRTHYATSQGQLNNYPKLTNNSDSKFLDDLEAKYPSFKDVIQAIKLRPNDYMPKEVQSKILLMLADKKNFTKEKSC